MTKADANQSNENLINAINAITNCEINDDIKITLMNISIKIHHSATLTQQEHNYWNNFSPEERNFILTGDPFFSPDHQEYTTVINFRKFKFPSNEQEAFEQQPAEQETLQQQQPVQRPVPPTIQQQTQQEEIQEEIFLPQPVPETPKPQTIVYPSFKQFAQPQTSSQNSNHLWLPATNSKFRQKEHSSTNSDTDSAEEFLTPERQNSNPIQDRKVEKQIEQAAQLLQYTQFNEQTLQYPKRTRIDKFLNPSGRNFFHKN